MNTVVFGSNATSCIACMKMRLTEHITHAREMKNAHNIFLENPMEDKPC
jgi:hypothetical protein